MIMASQLLVLTTDKSNKGDFQLGTLDMDKSNIQH